MFNLPILSTLQRNTAPAYPRSRAPKNYVFVSLPRGALWAAGPGWRGPSAGEGRGCAAVLPHVCRCWVGRAATWVWRMSSLLLQLAVLGVALAAAALILVRRGLGDRRGSRLPAVLETRPPRILSSAQPLFDVSLFTTLPPSLDPRISFPSISHPLSSLLYFYFGALPPSVPRPLYFCSLWDLLTQSHSSLGPPPPRISVHPPFQSRPLKTSSRICSLCSSGSTREGLEPPGCVCSLDSSFS